MTKGPSLGWPFLFDPFPSKGSMSFDKLALPLHSNSQFVLSFPHPFLKDGNQRSK